MLIKKSIFLAFFITCFFSLQSSQVTAVKDYMQAKKELKEACEQVNVDQVQALASYFHTQQLSTQEEKAAYKTILNAHTKTWSKKKKRGYLQLGLSATSFLLGYLCWNSEGYNTLQDYSSNMNPMLKETQNKLLHAYKQNNIGDIKICKFSPQ